MAEVEATESGWRSVQAALAARHPDRIRGDGARPVLRTCAPDRAALRGEASSRLELPRTVRACLSASLVAPFAF